MYAWIKKVSKLLTSQADWNAWTTSNKVRTYVTHLKVLLWSQHFPKGLIGGVKLGQLVQEEVLVLGQLRHLHHSGVLFLSKGSVKGMDKQEKLASHTWIYIHSLSIPTHPPTHPHPHSPTPPHTHPPTHPHPHVPTHTHTHTHTINRAHTDVCMHVLYLCRT